LSNSGTADYVAAGLLQPYQTVFSLRDVVHYLWGVLFAPSVVDLLAFLNFVLERWAPWKTLCKEIRRLQRDLYFGLLTECEERVRDADENGNYTEEVKRQKEFGLTREGIGFVLTLLNVAFYSPAYISIA
jgi:hypothetical protein